MHRTLNAHITEAINDASTFVLRHMPVNATTDEIYEDLIGDPQMAEAFANAAKYLPPNSLHKRITIPSEEYGRLSLNVRLTPTDKYPAFLMPQRTIDQKPLTHESRLSQALALPIRVARDWVMLKWAYEKLEANVDDAQALACLLPWMRELVAEWEKAYPTHPSFKPSRDRQAINRDVYAIMNERIPKRFPRVTEQLNSVCLSGKAMFSQYRMLKACSTNLDTAPVSVDVVAFELPVWLLMDMGEVLDDWKEEQLLVKLEKRGKR